MEHSDIGRIKSLALRDFLTYDELKYYPGNNLNIIIGPNGTGKSTIVAGIILGCGGKPALLSRSKDISDYVKNGKTKAHIELEIVANNRGGLITFHRAFDRDNVESYSIDGKKSSAREYLNRIKKFNIQVDNLCMFLPQDRVQDFTKLNPQELLLNTQISVCSPEINEAFDKLLKTREKQKNNTKHNEDIQTRLSDNINRNEQLRVLIDNNKLKDKLLAEVDILIKKKTWKEVEDLDVQYKEVDHDMKKMNELLNKKHAELRPLQAKVESIAGTRNDLRNSITKASTGMSSIQGEMDKLQEATENVESDINRAKQDLKNALSSIDSHKKRVEDMQTAVNYDIDELEKAKTALADEDVENQIQQCDSDIQKLAKNQNVLLKKRSDINKTLDETIMPALRNCERKIETLMDTQRKRIDVLRSNFEESYKAYEWLKENRNQFRGKIFNPILTEITVKEKDYAKYVENTIAIKDLTAFICTDKDDMKRLIVKFRNEMRLQVNIAFSEDTDEVFFAPSRSVQDYPHDLGFYAYLIDTIDGPAPVINYLCKLYNIHETLIGDDRTFLNAAQVPDHVRVFFSTEHRFAVSVSRYTGAKSSSSNPIRERNILTTAADARVKAREERNLQKWKQDKVESQNRRAQVEAEMGNVEAQIRDVRDAKNQLQAKINKVRMDGDRLRKKQAELQNLKNKKIDVDEEKKKFNANVDKFLKKLLEMAKKRVDKLEEYKNHGLQQELARKKLQVFQDSTGNLEEQIMAMQREIDTTKHLFDRVKVKFDSIKSRFKSKEEEAMKLTDGVNPKNPKFKHKEDFKKIPDTIGELQNLIEDLQGRIECMQGVDPRIITEYEDRCKEIENLQNQLANENHRLYNLEKDLNILHATWFPSISEVVEAINGKFSSFFDKMGFVGEVELIRKEERDYADYGIQIRVQYRDNERLQALNRHVQSGGERAVAIAVYTLSLQHLTSVPFRCVDEINQGMDPKNERKIFQMLVDITCQPDQSQYFFVTPKLLQDLPHSDLMTVSVVHNGKYIDDPYLYLDEDDGEQEEMDYDDVEVESD